MPKETKNEKIIESMNATPIIDTNVNIKIPRSPIAFDEKKHNFKCSCCGRGYSKQESYFQKSNDVLFQANGGYLPWCKECTDRYVEQMTALYSNNEEHAMKDFCQRAGWNYDIAALTASMETYSGHRSRSRISHYAAKKNLNCDGRKTYIDSLKNYYTQKQNEIITSREQAKSEESTISASAVDRWGVGFTEMDYKNLDEHWRMLKKNNPNADSNQEIFIRDLCNINMLKIHALQNGDSKEYATLVEQYSKTFKQAGLKTMNSMNSDGTFDNPQYQAMWDDMQKKEMDLYRYTGRSAEWNTVKLDSIIDDKSYQTSPDVNIVKDILAKSQSMATSYSSTIKQASQGEKANLTFEKLQKDGLDSALYSVHNTNSTAIFDEHGILIRSYDDVIDDYKDEQARINVNEFVYTTDRWRTAVTALGKQKYTLNGTMYEKYGLNTDFVISGLIIAGDLYSANYTTDSRGICTAGTHINLNDGSFVFAGGNLKYDNNELYVNGKITAISGKIGKYNITNSYLSTGTDSTCTGLGGNQAFWAGSENSNNAPFRVDYNGYMYANNVDISGKINANDGKIGGWNIDSSTIYQDYDKYRVYIQNPSSPETWVLSCQENKNNSYYGNWYVRADGYMYASKGQIGNFTIDNGTLVTYQKNGVKGISMNQNYINFYSWVDDYENYVGSITTTKYYTNNGETRRALTLNADYGDVVGINCTKEKTGNTEYEFVVRINDDLNKSLEFF